MHREVRNRAVFTSSHNGSSGRKISVSALRGPQFKRTDDLMLSFKEY